MTWSPISRDDLETLLREELARCPAELQTFFRSVQIDAVKWAQHP